MQPSNELRHPQPRKLISDLVDRFYTRVRNDDILGPIFDAAIGDDWDNHLPKMKSFWSAIALRDGSYHGNPIAAHRALPDLSPRHFSMWLELFAQTVDELDDSASTKAFFMERANRIAQSLQLAMWGPNGKPAKKLAIV